MAAELYTGLADSPSNRAVPAQRLGLTDSPSNRAVQAQRLGRADPPATVQRSRNARVTAVDQTDKRGGSLPMSVELHPPGRIAETGCQHAPQMI